MAITRVGTPTTNSSSATTTLSINKPTGVTAGMVMVAGIVSDGTVPTPPANWTEFGGQSSSNYNVHLYWKTATSSEPTFYTWTVGNVGPSAGYITAWSGVDATLPAGPIAVVQSSLSATAVDPEPGDTPGVDTGTVAAGRLFYVRAVRRGDAGGSAVTAVLSEGAEGGATVQASVGNVSGTENTSYSIGLFSADADFSAAGAYGGIEISCDQPEDTNYLATYALRASATGTVAATLPKLGAAFAGHHRIDASLAFALPKLEFSAVGTAAPPSGYLETELLLPTVAADGNTLGGSFAATLPSVEGAAVGSVNPIGTFSVGLPMPTMDAVLETRTFGLHVIVVEPEKRALRITDAKTEPIFRSQVAFEEQDSNLNVKLPLLTSNISGYSYSGEFDFTLPKIQAALTAQTVNGDLGVSLPKLTASFDGAIINGSFDLQLPSLDYDFTGNPEVAGSFTADLWLPDIDIASAAVTVQMDVQLPSIPDVFLQGHFGNQEGDLAVELPLLTADFEADAIQDDLLKYAAPVGDGTNTSYTVTHNFGSRDVVVCVYDNTTYEEVMPLTTHATTNTVTVAFAAPPATDAYRVVVLYSNT